MKVLGGLTHARGEGEMLLGNNLQHLRRLRPSTAYSPSSLFFGCFLARRLRLLLFLRRLLCNSMIHLSIASPILDMLNTSIILNVRRLLVSVFLACAGFCLTPSRNLCLPS